MSRENELVPAEPCGQCPLRLDAPRGIWSQEHYAMLLSIDDPHKFKCHRSRRTGAQLMCAGSRMLGQEGMFRSMVDAAVENIHACDVLARFRTGCPGTGEECDPDLLKDNCPVCGMELPTNGSIPAHTLRGIHSALVEAGISYQSLPAIMDMGPNPLLVIRDYVAGKLPEDQAVLITEIYARRGSRSTSAQTSSSAVR